MLAVDNLYSLKQYAEIIFTSIYNLDLNNKEDCETTVRMFNTLVFDDDLNKRLKEHYNALKQLRDRAKQIEDKNLPKWKSEALKVSSLSTNSKPREPME